MPSKVQVYFPNEDHDEALEMVARRKGVAPSQVLKIAFMGMVMSDPELADIKDTYNF